MSALAHQAGRLGIAEPTRLSGPARSSTGCATPGPGARRRVRLVARWEIEKLAPGGEGLSRAGGQVGFARGVVPGDVLCVTEVEQRAGYQRALSFEVLSPGPERVAPDCEYHGRCGGCDFMQLSLEGQRAAKLALVREALVRTGSFREENLPPIDLVRGAPRGYRSRAQLQVTPSGEAGFSSARSHELVPARECLVCEPALSELIGFAVRLGEQGAWRGLSRLELRTSPVSPERLIRAVPSRGASRRAPAGFVTPEEALAEANVTLVVAGSKEDRALDQRWPLSEGVFLRAPATAFTQVNWEINRELVAAVVRGALARGAARFLDLYCGAGNFSLALAARGLAGLGLEGNAAAVHAARRGLAALTVGGGAQRDRAVAGASTAPGHVRFEVCDLATLSRSAFQRTVGREAFDLVLLDPPRSGAASLMSHLASLDCPHFALCACDPVTLARDLKTLTQAGLQLEELSVFDMFPETHHVEVLAWLTRVPRA